MCWTGANVGWIDCEAPEHLSVEEQTYRHSIGAIAACSAIMGTHLDGT